MEDLDTLATMSIPELVDRGVHPSWLLRWFPTLEVIDQGVRHVIEHHSLATQVGFPGSLANSLGRHGTTDDVRQLLSWHNQLRGLIGEAWYLSFLRYSWEAAKKHGDSLSQEIIESLLTDETLARQKSGSLLLRGSGR